MQVPEHAEPTEGQLRAIPPGPDSLMWRYFGDSRFLLFFGQGLTMQAAHPVIGQGVADFSVFKTDPYGRFQRSLALLWPVVYNTPEGALAYGARLREMHRAIKGKFSDGKAYHAFNPEAYLWVHMLVFDAVLRIAVIDGEPLNPAEQEQLYDEWRQMGLLLGIREQDLPTDIPAFWTRFEDIIQNSLAMNETLDYLLRKGYYLRVPKPPLSWLPQAAWQPIYPFAGTLAWFATRATLPASFRAKFQVAWSRRDERNFQRAIKVSRIAWKALPENVRYLPQAYAAIRDARENPQNYSWSTPA